MGICETSLLAQSPDPIYMGIVGLAFVLLVIFCVVARKTWGWIDITFTILSFIAGAAAIWGATQVFSLRSKDLAAVRKHEKDFEKFSQEADKLIYGDPTSVTYDPGSLRAVTSELNRELGGRGRVWSSNNNVTSDGDNRVFAFTEQRVDVAERPLLDVVVFAFLNRAIGNQDYPALYIGAVNVESETGANVTLSPVALAEPEEFERPTGSWTLFEKMPLDRRGSFKQAAVALLKDNPNNPPNVTQLLENLQDETADLDISLFRELLTTRYLPADDVGLDADSREYEQLIDMYAFDGISLGKIQNWIDQNSAGRKTLQFEPPPEEVFIQYKFNKDSRKPYPVDANGSVETDGLFTPLGLAVDEGLHAGKEIEFKQGDTVLVDQRSADGYQRGDNTIPPFKDNEDVTQVDRIFIRQVRDFPFEFADLREQTARMISETDIVDRNDKIQAKSLADGKAQQASRETLMANLEQDQTALIEDLETIKRLLNDRSSESDLLKQKVAVLESRIRDFYYQLRSVAAGQARRAFVGN